MEGTYISSNGSERTANIPKTPDADPVYVGDFLVAVYVNKKITDVPVDIDIILKSTEGVFRHLDTRKNPSL